MAKYAKIIVDIPVKKLDQHYTYRIPNKLKRKIKVGQAVLVPFGRRKITGFIVGFTNKSNIKENKIKDISKVIYLDNFFDDDLLNLFQWMASYYKVNLINVIKTGI